MVDSAGGSYREKYRRALADQERMEKQFEFQLDALRKTLVHLSAACQGLDKQLDAALINLKQKMRGASGPQVLEQMERVHNAAIDYEQSRQALGLSAAKQLTGIVDQISELKIPSHLKANLTSFGNNIKDQLKTQSNYPLVLEELRKLHGLALQAATNRPTSLWQRLKGGKTLSVAKQDAQPRGPVGKLEPETVASETTEKESQDDVDATAPQDMDITPIDVDMREPRENIGWFEPGNEESYQEVAQRIACTLKNLIDRIEPNDLVRHKIDIVRARIQRGMDWYALSVTLEDIRDILLLRYLQNDQEFSEYLKRVNQELKVISDALVSASQKDQQNRSASEKLSSTIFRQVNQMRDNVGHLTTIEGLKSAVDKHLTVIQTALGDYQQQVESSGSLSDQLKNLINHVQGVEKESIETKKMLEEARYRATHDPLTGLPNREAYNERAYQELQRYKRYCRPLTLAVCDIDHFKTINDAYGHQAGDKVLKLIAQLISTRLRKVDFVARYGGEEFVMLMPETPIHKALNVLDKIRAVVGHTPFKFKGSPVNITISFGLANFAADDTVESVFERADKSLYKAKEGGRNQCVMTESTSDVPRPVDNVAK